MCAVHRDTRGSKRRIPTIIALSCLIGLPGCVTKNQSYRMSANLDPDSSASLAAFHAPSVSADHKDYALHELVRAQVLLEAGNCVDADARLSIACKIMDRITGDEARERAAVVWTESSKVFKGQPYERALAWFYRGVSRYQMGDYSGALACFRHSLACDQETRSQEQADLEDFVIAYFMAARAYDRLGERSNAEAALASARRYAPGVNCLSVEALEANCVIIVATGLGPHIRPSRFDASIATVDCPKSSDVQVRVLVDGQHAGNADMITDMLEQARSQGWGAMDSIRLAKGIGKQIVSHLPYVGLASHLIRAECDTRCWYNMPRLFHVFAGNISPGVHSISLDIRDVAGQAQPRYGQTWHHIRFSAEGETLLLLRSVRNAQNHYNLIPVDLSARKPEPVTSADRASAS